MATTLKPRGRALRWLTTHRYCTEQPPGSNRDRRKDGITAAQRRLGDWLVGLPWCGVWACNAAMAGGVKPRKPYRWASVELIEEDARAKRNGFRGWQKSSKGVLRGDLIVLFGRGVHVEVVRRVYRVPGTKRFGWVYTDGGNTSPGNSGSQANGGGSYPRWRRIRDAHGFALVNFPG